MKHFYFLIQSSPDFSFTQFDFEAFQDLLYSNIFVVTVLICASILIAVAFYFSICCLALGWNEVMSNSIQPKGFVQEITSDN